jgi:hypothetical protein
MAGSMRLQIESLLLAEQIASWRSWLLAICSAAVTPTFCACGVSEW